MTRNDAQERQDEYVLAASTPFDDQGVRDALRNAFTRDTRRDPIHDEFAALLSRLH